MTLSDTTVGSTGLVSVAHHCCRSTFTARTLPAAQALHASYHNDQYNRGRRDALVPVPSSESAESVGIGTRCTLSVPCAEGTRTCAAHKAGTYNVILHRPDADVPVLVDSEATWIQANAWVNTLEAMIGVLIPQESYVGVYQVRY